MISFNEPLIVDIAEKHNITTVCEYTKQNKKVELKGNVNDIDKFLKEIKNKFNVYKTVDPQVIINDLFEQQYLSYISKQQSQYIID